MVRNGKVPGIVLSTCIIIITFGVLELRVTVYASIADVAVSGVENVS